MNLFLLTTNAFFLKKEFVKINDTILAKQLIQFYEQTERVFSEIFIDLNF